MTFTRTRFLLGLMADHGPWILLGLVCAFIAAAANITLLAVSGWFITGMAQVGLLLVAEYNYFVPSALIRGCAIFRTGGRYLERLFTHDASLRVIATLRPRLFRGLSRLPVQAPTLATDIDTTHSATQAARIGADLDTLQRFYLQILVPGLVAAGVGVLVLMAGFFQSPTIGFVLLGALLLGGVVLPAGLAWAGQRVGHRIMRQRNTLRTMIVDALGGRDELIAFGAMDRQLEKLNDANRALTRSRYVILRQDAIGAALLPGLANLTMWVVALLLVPASLGGEISAMAVVMLVFLALSSFELLAPLPEAFQRLGATNAVLDDVMTIPMEKKGPVFANAPPLQTPGRVDILLTDIRIKPLKAGVPPPLDHLSLHIPQGRKIGIVGASGAGKSTLARLLCGEAEWTGGTFLVDGQPLVGTNDSRLAGLVSLSPQTPAFLSDTLRRNLEVADPDASTETLMAVLEKVRLMKWFSTLSDGLETFIGEGGRPLSGGEARRLSLARALLGKGPVLVLDEPGEGLDPALEADVLGDVFNAAGDRTILLITHRHQGLEKMDEILVLDEGQVLERGNPWELTGKDGAFHQFLVQSAI